MTAANLEHEMTALAHTRAQYTCPMHPEMIRDEPGACPLCGMALEPLIVSAEETESAELIDMRRRFWVSATLSLPVLIAAMSESVPLLGVIALPSLRAMFEAILSTPVVLWGGRPSFVRAWRSLVNRSPNMFTLIGLGVGAAYLYSVVAILFPQIFPPSSSHGGQADGPGVGRERLFRLCFSSLRTPHG